VWADKGDKKGNEKGYTKNDKGDEGDEKGNEKGHQTQLYI